jgi:hypothetical protein
MAWYTSNSRFLTIKRAAVLLGILALAAMGFGSWRYLDDALAPLFLNSKIERLGEKNLPKAVAEGGDTIYCRMKADDFRFPLPPQSHAVLPILITGGFDTVDGSVRVQFDGSNSISASAYEAWISSRMQEGGQVTAESVPGGLVVKFHYFGDR